MALLGISDYLTELHHLWLVGLVHITIIGISWLADRCTKLMELDVSVRHTPLYCALTGEKGAITLGYLS